MQESKQISYIFDTNLNDKQDTLFLIINVL